MEAYHEKGEALPPAERLFISRDPAAFPAGLRDGCNLTWVSSARSPRFSCGLRLSEAWPRFFHRNLHDLVAAGRIRGGSAGAALPRLVSADDLQENQERGELSPEHEYPPAGGSSRNR